MKSTTPRTISIVVVPGQDTIYAMPKNGNVVDAGPGTQVTWTSKQPFQITFFAISGTTTTIHKGPISSESCNGQYELAIPFRDAAYLEYVVESVDPETKQTVTLDPYIHVD